MSRMIVLQDSPFSAERILGRVVYQVRDKITIPIGPGVTTADYTIPPVVLSDTLLFLEGWFGDLGGADALSVFPRINFLNATTVRATKHGNEDACDVYFNLVQLLPGVLEYVERGSGTTTLQERVRPGSPVNLLGHNQSDSGAYKPHRAVLSGDGATITVTGGATVNWQVFDMGAA